MLGDGSDLNTAQSLGVYPISINDVTNVNNFPSGETYTYGMLIVFQAGSFTNQLYLPNNTGNSIWIRSYYSGSGKWQNWQSIDRH